jgi:hypothetical protein
VEFFFQTGAYLWFKNVFFLFLFYFIKRLANHISPARNSDLGIFRKEFEFVPSLDDLSGWLFSGRGRYCNQMNNNNKKTKMENRSSSSSFRILFVFLPRNSSDSGSLARGWHTGATCKIYSKRLYIEYNLLDIFNDTPKKEWNKK